MISLPADSEAVVLPDDLSGVLTQETRYMNLSTKSFNKKLLFQSQRCFFAFKEQEGISWFIFMYIVPLCIFSSPRWHLHLRCLQHRYVFDSAMNVGRLVAQVADKSQQKTQLLGSDDIGEVMGLGLWQMSIFSWWLVPYRWIEQMLMLLII